MNLAEHFESQSARKKFWVEKCGAKPLEDSPWKGAYWIGNCVVGNYRTEQWNNPLSDDVRLETLVNLLEKVRYEPAGSKYGPDDFANLMMSAWEAKSELGTALREALITALMEVERCDANFAPNQ